MADKQMFHEECRCGCQRWFTVQTAGDRLRLIMGRQVSITSSDIETMWLYTDGVVKLIDRMTRWLELGSGITPQSSNRSKSKTMTDNTQGQADGGQGAGAQRVVDNLREALEDEYDLRLYVEAKLEQAQARVRELEALAVDVIYKAPFMRDPFAAQLEEYARRLMNAPKPTTEEQATPAHASEGVDN